MISCKILAEKWLSDKILAEILQEYTYLCKNLAESARILQDNHSISTRVQTLADITEKARSVLEF